MARLLLLVAAVLVGGCKHPLAIQGLGDIVELQDGVRGCTFEEFAAGDDRCDENIAFGGDYIVTYEPQPREGWVFSHWDGTACGPSSAAPLCEYIVPPVWVALFNDTAPDLAVPATRAVFEELDSDADGQVDSYDPLPQIPSDIDNVDGNLIPETDFFFDGFRAEAPLLDTSGSVTVQGAVDFLFDVQDLFTVVAPANGTLNLLLGQLTDDVDLYLRGPGGELLAFSEAFGAVDESIVFEVEAGQVYYVSVLAFDASSYQLDVTLENSSNPPNAGNVSGDYQVTAAPRDFVCVNDEYATIEGLEGEHTFSVNQDGDLLDIAFPVVLPAGTVLSWERMIAGRIESSGVFEVRIERRFDDPAEPAALYQWVSIVGQIVGGNLAGYYQVRTYDTDSGDDCDSVSELSGSRAPG